MGFDPRQRKALRAKLRYANIRSRVHNGSTLNYIEGWMAVAEANRIFGHENWDRETRSPSCIWSDRQRGQFVCLYSAQVRISVRAGDTIVTRDGVGTGFGRASSPESAHEMAMKAAETDATKRALATFGNPFGLALYDKDLNQVTKPVGPTKSRLARSSERQQNQPIVILTGRKGRQIGSSGGDDLVGSIAKELAELKTVEAVYAFWEANLTNFACVLEHDPIGNRAVIDTVTAKLKEKLQDLRGSTRNESGAPTHISCGAPSQTEMSATVGSSEGTATVNETSERENFSSHHTATQPISRQTVETTNVPPHDDQPAPLPRAKDRRIRDAEHLAFVRRHPCVVCGRRPAQAHHVRFAQPRAMAMKVSDEYTVPLCAGHHDSLHRSGDERAWWAARKIEPLAIALNLWSSPDKSVPFPTLEITAADT